MAPMGPVALPLAPSPQATPSATAWKLGLTLDPPLAQGNKKREIRGFPVEPAEAGRTMLWPGKITPAPNLMQYLKNYPSSV